MAVPRYLYPLDHQRTHEPVGHTFHPPKPCVDCGVMVEDSKGMERNGAKRCGKCDIAACEKASKEGFGTAAWWAKQ